jgi:hypothetical protein
MRLITLVLQIVGLVLLVPAVALGTLWLKHRDADGPSILLPGGALVSGSLHQGAEPDWRFVDGVGTVELQLFDPTRSRRVWIVQTDGRIFVPSGYMTSALGRVWKHWAVQAEQGDGRAVLRIDGVRYDRRLVRLQEGDVLDRVASVLAAKYRAPLDRTDIEAGNTWIFELTPVGG